MVGVLLFRSYGGLDDRIRIFDMGQKESRKRINTETEEAKYFLQAVVAEQHSQLAKIALKTGQVGKRVPDDPASQLNVFGSLAA